MRAGRRTLSLAHTNNMATASGSAEPGERAEEDEAIKNASDEIFTHTCTPCIRSNRNAEAVEYCLDCKEYFCSICRDFHRKFGVTSSHQVVDKTQFPPASSSSKHSPDVALMLPTERCAKHHGKLIDTYCGTCNHVCCATCVILYHRSCEDVQYIPNLAEEAMSSSEAQNSMEAAKKVQARLQTAKREHEAEDTRLALQKNTDANRIERIIESLVDKLQELKQAAVNELKNKHHIANEKNAENVKQLDDKIQSLEARIKQLENNTAGNMAQQFVDMKMTQILEIESKELLAEQKKAATENIEFVIDKDILEMMNNKTSVCDFIDNREFEAGVREKYNLTATDDKKKSDLTGICQMDDGSYLITDWTNKKLKKTDKNFRLTDQCSLNGLPFAVCMTNSGKAAVSLTYEQRVQLVDISPKLNPLSSFDIGSKCRGIAYSAGELFVSCGGDTDEGVGQVRVYDMNGNFLRILQDKTRPKVFFKPRHIVASEDNTKIHVADTDHGALTLDRQGNLLSVVKDQDFKNPWGVCIGEGRLLFYCRRYTNKVGYGDWQGKSHLLLRESDDIKKPQALVYDRRSSRLVIIEEKTNEIQVCRIEKK